MGTIFSGLNSNLPSKRGILVNGQQKQDWGKFFRDFFGVCGAKHYKISQGKKGKRGEKKREKEGKEREASGSLDYMKQEQISNLDR